MTTEEAAKILALLPSKIERYEFLIGKQISLFLSLWYNGTN